jgi:hypothetical protein
VCRQAIEAPYLQYELKGRGDTFLHATCYIVWLEESQRLVPLGNRALTAPGTSSLSP